jgi:hypothetical protein
MPLPDSTMRSTQEKTLAVMQVSGRLQSFNAVNRMRTLGRRMRMITIPNQSSILKAFQEFDAARRMRPSPRYDRIVDVLVELMKFTMLTRDRADHLVDCCCCTQGNGAGVDGPDETVSGDVTRPICAPSNCQVRRCKCGFSCVMPKIAAMAALPNRVGTKAIEKTAAPKRATVIVMIRPAYWVMLRPGFSRASAV